MMPFPPKPGILPSDTRDSQTPHRRRRRGQEAGQRLYAAAVMLTLPMLLRGSTNEGPGLSVRETARGRWFQACKPGELCHSRQE